MLPDSTRRRQRAKADGYRRARPLHERLRRLRKPVLALWGPQDRIAPVAGLDLSRTVRGATVVTIPGAGHSPMYERPRATLAALRSFLRPPRS